MAITSITIENFKGIGDAVTIPIRPLTLLFGKNNSGKSTVLQAMRYLRKIFEHLQFEEKLETLQAHEKDEPKLKSQYDILNSLQILCSRRASLNTGELRKIISQKILNLDLSNFDSLRDEALKSMQEKFYLPDDWLAEETIFLTKMTIMENMEKSIQIILLR